MTKDDFTNNNNNPKIDLTQQHLANERTFLAWVRTCIALIGLGFIISKFSFFLVKFQFIFQNYITNSSNLAANNNNTEVAGSEQLSSLIGIGIVILSIVLILFALKNYLDTTKSLYKKRYEPKNITVYFTTAIIIGLTLAVTIYLLYIFIQSYPFLLILKMHI